MSSGRIHTSRYVSKELFLTEIKKNPIIIGLMAILTAILRLFYNKIKKSCVW